MVRKHRPSAALRARYPLRMQLGFALSLGLVITVFRMPLPEGGDGIRLLEERAEIVSMEEIEQTRQHEPPPPPSAPPPPIAVPDDAVVEDVHLNLDIDLDLTARAVVPPPPPPPAAAPPPPAPPPPPPEDEIFTVVEQPPVLIGSLADVQRRVSYPEIARRAGIEGTVHVQFVIDEQGRVVDPVCVREPGGGTCEAAIAAVRDARFEPGRQRGRPVKVRYAMPIRFRLQDAR